MLVILRGSAYGDERAYNGLRLAGNLAKRDEVEVKVFCFGDAVGCAVAGQQVPNGYYRRQVESLQVGVLRVDVVIEAHHRRPRGDGG